MSTTFLSINGGILILNVSTIARLDVALGTTYEGGDTSYALTVRTTEGSSHPVVSYRRKADAVAVAERLSHEIARADANGGGLIVFVEDRDDFGKCHISIRGND